MKKKLLALALCGAALGTVPAPAITFDPFGPKGEGGSKNGQTILIGAGGSVHELDGFLGVGGLDLNGSQVGTCAQLSRDSLPAGLAYGFASALSSNQADLVLTYSFTNTTAGTFSDLRFFLLLDAEIDEAANTFFNEYGVVEGIRGLGPADADPDQWQIDEPGFQTGSLFRNLLVGVLSNSNAVPPTAANDVALALGFTLGNLTNGNWTAVQIMISESTNRLGSLALVQRDSSPASATTITLSGTARVNVSPFGDVTELIQMGFSQWQLNPATGSLLGTIGINNPPTNAASFGPPYQLGLKASPDFYYPHPGGTLPDGVPYVDLTATVQATVAGGTLAPGQGVVLTSAVEVYSLYRSPPTNTLFEIWATKQ